jgi:hypothetical protein
MVDILSLDENTNGKKGGVMDGRGLDEGNCISNLGNGWFYLGRCCGLRWTYEIMAFGISLLGPGSVLLEIFNIEPCVQSLSIDHLTILLDALCCGQITRSRDYRYA